ncbi:MAG: IS4 family transposase [Pirellulales bacterium]
MLKDVSTLSDQEFTSAVELLRELVPADEPHVWLPSEAPMTVYTTLVTLWMLVLQRLGGGRSMEAIVKEVLSYSGDLLPDNKRIREGRLSESSSAYSQARKRLSIETVEFFTQHVCDSLIESSPSWFDGRRAFIIDGTTITLAPTEELRKAFPPATNQHGETVWPVAMLLVAHELQSGCALPLEIGPMYGEHNTSEAKLAWAIVKRLPPASIVLGDAGFGIFSVAYYTVQQGHDILFRLTKARFKSLRKRATLIEQTEHGSLYRVNWKPSVKDRQTTPELPDDAEIELFLHEVSIPGETLYLATTLELDSESAGEIYGCRYDVEHDIRDLKVTLDTENIRAKSVAMVKKELMTSLVAYNLVMQFRRQAAEVAKVPPRRLSFTGVWDTFKLFLLYQPTGDLTTWKARYERALNMAARCKLPNRPGRSYPRQAHPRRPKSTKFMKLKTKQQNTLEKPPPEKPK